MLEYLSKNAQDTKNFAKDFAGKLTSGDIIAFKGAMGAGKTTFVSGLIEGLNINASVSSPTFAIMNEYKGEKIKVYHFDMYRITDFDSLYSTGFFDFLEEKDSIILIEWSENITDELPENIICITIKRDSSVENMRSIIVEGDRF